MERLYVIGVDDQKEVVSTLSQNLSPLANYVRIEECESGEEAWELINEIDFEGDYVAIVVADHVMPGKTGVELLSDIHNDERFTTTKKVLLTGQATHQDTIEAINNAAINMYFDKPWDQSQLLQSVKILITRFLLETGLDYNPFRDILDDKTLMDYLKRQTGI